MKNLAKVWGLALILAVTFCAAQAAAPKADKKKVDKKAAASDTTDKPAAEKPPLGQNLATVVNDTNDTSDSVPCFFTLKQLMELRPVPGVPKLTEYDQSRVLTRVVEAVDTASEKEISRSQKARFISILATKLDGQLVGKTPGEALATIMDILYQITAKNADLSTYAAASNPSLIRQAVVDRARKYGGDTFATALQKQLDASGSWYKPKDLTATLDQISAIVATVPDTLSSAVKTAANQTAKDLLVPQPDILVAAKNRDTMMQVAADKARLYGGDAFSQAVRAGLSDPTVSWYKPNDPNGTLGGAATVVEMAPQKVQDPGANAAATQTIQDLSDASSGQLTGSVVESARSTINKFTRPIDIACAYEILDWNSSRMMFGRSVANNFIGIQVTVRNLNAKEEFIVHNAMMSVDTDIHGAIGQYFQGVDKTGIEAFNNAGESLTVRGIIGNSITAATTLLSALQPIVNVGNFSNAVAAFNGGVPQGWGSLEKDHQKDQLLLIANSGFSATGNSKTVVSKSGAATFYVWFPAKPFLQGWWLQDCAQEIAAVENPGDKDPRGATNPPEVGVDLVRARHVCQGVTASTWNTTPYQKWSSISDKLFRDLSLAVVAGIHVREDSKNQATVTDLKCAKDAQGRLDLSKPSTNGTLVCDFTGENLDKVTKLRLENSGNLVDPARPDGVVSEVSSDNASAKVTFNASDLLSLAGDSYNLFAIGKDGTETATGQKVELDRTTVELDKVDPATFDSAKPSPLTLTGHNLDKIKNIALSTGAAGAECKTSAITAPTVTRATLDLSKLTLAPGTLNLYFEDCTEAHNSKQTVTVLTTAGH